MITTATGPAELTVLKRLYFAALAAFLVAAMVCVFQARHRLVLEQTRDKLVKAKAGLALMRQAGEVRRATLAQYGPYLGGNSTASPEHLLYQRLDLIKARLQPGDLTISGIEHKGEEVSLQYSLKFDNPPLDDFLNAIGYLESWDFPLGQVHALAVTAPADGKGGLSCTVNGRIVAFGRKR